MKITWKKKKNNKRPITTISHLPFDQEEDTTDEAGEDAPAQASTAHDTSRLAQSFEAEGNKLAEMGKYREALGKWEAAITLMPEKATLHEEKAQVLLEIGETWKSLMAATRATQLEPSWAEAELILPSEVDTQVVTKAWVTLGRAQLNFGEPDSAIESFDTALAIKPDSVEAKEDRQTALHLIKKRKQLHSSGISVTENRYVVGENTQGNSV